jgi:hypothetical protein
MFSDKFIDLELNSDAKKLYSKISELCPHLEIARWYKKIDGVSREGKMFKIPEVE